MRKDMDKVLTERPRNGRGNTTARDLRGKTKYRRGLDDEDYVHPPMGGRKRVYGYDFRMLNDHLGPLLKWVHQQVGRPWNKVYAEACSGFDSRSMGGNHIREHLHQWVDAYGNSRHYKSKMSPEGWFRKNFIVDDHGLLRASPPYRWPKRRPEEVTDIRTEDPNVWLRKRNGIWFRDTFSWITKQPHEKVPVYEIVVRDGITWYRVSVIKQLNTRELADAGLENDPG